MRYREYIHINHRWWGAAEGWPAGGKADGWEPGTQGMWPPGHPLTLTLSTPTPSSLPLPRAAVGKHLQRKSKVAKTQVRSASRRLDKYPPILSSGGLPQPELWPKRLNEHLF